MKNNYTSMIFTILLSLYAGGIPPAWGQSPPGLMNFQGRLTDSSNNPLSGPHDFTFGVYDALTGGNQLWTETQIGVAVANGVLAAQLGAANAVPAAIFAAPAAYLQITVDGTALSPRQRLATAPYAFNSDSLQGRGYAAFVSTDSAAQTIAGDKTFTGALAAAQLRLSGSVSVSSESLSSLGAGVRISTNIYIVGFSSAAKYYGDGSALTGISLAGDDLGSHVASLNLNMSGLQILNVASMTVTGKDAGSGYSLFLSSGINMAAGTVNAGLFLGDGGGLYNVLASSVAAGGVRPGSLAPGAVSAAGQIADGTITLAKLSQSGCADNQVPKWNGAAWACAADVGITYTADEAGLHLSGGVFSALSSSVTLQGNSFNSADRLLRLDSSGYLPALNGSLLTNVSSAQFSAVATDTSTIAGGLTAETTNRSGADTALSARLNTVAVDTATLRTDLNAKAADSAVVHLASAETISGVKTFSADPVFSAAAIPQAAVSGLTAALASKAAYEGVRADTTTIAGGLSSELTNRAAADTALSGRLNTVAVDTTSLRTDVNAKAADGAVVHLASAENITGVKTFSADPVFSAAAIPQSAINGLTAALAAKAAYEDVRADTTTIAGGLSAEVTNRASADTALSGRINTVGVDTTTLKTQLDLKADLASPAFTGNVGIGTASPGIDLDVLGAARISNQGAATNAATGKGLEMQYITSGRAQGEGAYLISYDRTASAYKPFIVDASSVNFANSGGAAMAIVGGNVGIGTTNPTWKLQVSGNQYNNYNFTDATGSAFNISGNNGVTSTGTRYVNYFNITARPYAAAGAAFNGYHRAMMIDTTLYDSGLTNTGTLATAEGIHINYGLELGGAGTAISSLYGINLSPFNTKTVTTHYGLYVGAVSAGTDYSVYAAGANNYFAGKVGIGTAGPTGKLEVAGSGDVILNPSGSIGLRGPANGRFLVAVGGAGDTAWTSPSTLANDSAAFLVRPASIANASGTGDISNALIAGVNLNPAGASSIGATLRVGASAETGAGGFATMASVYIDGAPTGGTSGNGALLVAAGNVGIGTTNPGYKLDVNGTVRVGTADGNYNTIFLDTAYGGVSNHGLKIKEAGWGAPYPVWGMVQNNANAGLTFAYETIAAGFTFVSPTNVMTLKTDGNVGIGTTAPAGKLHVNSGSAGSVTANASADDLIVENNSASGISILNPDANAGRLIFGSPSNNANAMIYAYNNAGSPYLQGIANGNVGWTVGSTGNVGIGTTGPFAKLQVGNFSMTGGDVPTAGPQTMAMNINSPNSTALGDQGYQLTLLESSALGANKGGALGFQAVYDGSNNITTIAGIKGLRENATASNHAGYLSLLTRAGAGTISEKMRIDSAGNVGIGTTPKTWDTWYNALQIGAGGFLFGHDTAPASAGFGSNVYIASGYKRAGVGQAVLLDTEGGTFNFMTAPSGAADSVISWTNAMTVLNSGSVGIGSMAPVAKLDVNGVIQIGGSVGAPGTTGVYIGAINGYCGGGCSYVQGGYLGWDDTTDTLQGVDVIGKDDAFDASCYMHSVDNVYCGALPMDARYPIVFSVKFN
ncbi:MAG: hypothetical protein Q7R35_19865 [Elusimicrobiota bacterium]|nr:hypothetical protein [Elusimicrobiota bacterium]